MRKRILAGALAIAGLGMAMPAAATTFVVTPNSNTSSPGTNNANSPFGAAGTSTMYVMQVQYAASLFSNVTVGSKITQIGFRLAPGSTTNSKALSYTNFGVQIGSAAKAIGSLAKSFSANMGADTITARTGALSFAKNALKVDACTTSRCKPKVLTNSFFMIDLTNPYTYNGGDLVITLSSTLAASTVGQIVTLDAVDPYLINTVSTNANNTSSGTMPTSGLAVNFFFAPIMQFAFEAPAAAATVPEPASWAMMLGGFGLLGTAMRGQRRRAQVRA